MRLHVGILFTSTLFFQAAAERVERGRQPSPAGVFDPALQESGLRPEAKEGLIVQKSNCLITFAGNPTRMNRCFFLLLMMAVVFSSCKKDDDPAVDTVPNAADISGSVFLYSEGTDRVANDGMTVAVANVDPARSAVTDASGKFVIKDVPLGTPILTFSKSGYGTYKMFDIAHVKDDQTTVITTIPSLGAVSSTQVTALTANVSGGEVSIQATTTPAGSANSSRYVRLFMHTAANASSVFYTVYSPTFVARINPYVKTYTKAELNAMGFASGTTVFVRVYGDSYWSNQYDDPGLDKRVFPNLNPNSVAAVSFVVP